MEGSGTAERQSSEKQMINICVVQMWTVEDNAP